MHYRRLGHSNLQVSRLCLEAMMFGDQTEAREAGEIVAHAKAQGVNFIDTADVYTQGASEHMLGQLLSRGIRDEHAKKPAGCGLECNNETSELLVICVWWAPRSGRARWGRI